MKSVVICGSKRFAAEIGTFAAELRRLGIVTFEPNFSEPIPETSEFSSDHVRNIIFKGITLEHFEWIRRADICYIHNSHEYCGVSVTLEMGYAFALGKVIIASSKNTGDPCRDSLIDFIASTPRDVFDILNGAPIQNLLR